MRPIIYCLLALAITSASAQDALAPVQLNSRATTPATPELLYQRAMAHRAEGNIDLAAADLHAATKAKPDMLAWQLERSRVELLANRPSRALTIANQALSLAKNGTARAQIHIIRAEAYLATSKYKPSLHACQLAFKEMPKGEPQWYLLRSHCQRKLGHFDARISALRSGLKNFPSSHLKPHLVDAMIDAGKHSEALTIINQEIATQPYQPTWLIKRARVHHGLGSTQAAQTDLQEALREIDSQLNPAQPDPTLLADKARVFLLQNNPTAAAHIVTLMQRHKAPISDIKEISSQLPGK